MKIEAVLRSESETFALGERLGALLQTGDFIALEGELGAGKTLFSRGVAKGAGVDVGQVSSPTYSIVQSYAGRVPLHHADWYRLRDEAELYGTGFFDLEGACLVEWADRLPHAVPSKALWLKFEVLDATTRKLVAASEGERHDALLAKLFALQRDVIFFDGSCGLCHRLVQFALPRDRAHRFDYAPLGGETFMRLTLAQREGLPDSVVILRSSGELLVRWAATMHLLRGLSGVWSWLGRLGALVPRALGDVLYDWVAKNRARWFERPKESCPLVPPQLRSRFLK